MYTIGTDGIKRSDDPLKYLGHDQRWKAGGNGTLGYSDVGTFHDVWTMVDLKVIILDEDTEAETASGTAYPGQCKKNDPYPFNKVNHYKILIYH